jgi:hypothetical protein
LKPWDEEVTLLTDLHHKARTIKGDVAKKYPLVVPSGVLTWQIFDSD